MRIDVSIPNRDFSWLQFAHANIESGASDKFQSLIGILVDCNTQSAIITEKFDDGFQSLIGILVDCNRVYVKYRGKLFVSIPNRDFSWLQ